MKNPATSIRARLLNYSKQNQLSFQELLDHFAMGRFLWRLSRSKHCDRYILKGAQLFRLWSSCAHRPTRDLDLLGQGEPDEATLKANFGEVLKESSDPADGLIWGEVETGLIRHELKYGGVRAVLRASLDGARIALQVDVGYGDSVSPQPRRTDWDGLLDFPAAHLLVYPPETVVAEKLEAAVVLGVRNSRMKDFFDLDWLCQHMEFDHTTLRAAIVATFNRRGSTLPDEAPLALTEEFAHDAGKITQWKAFLRKNRLEADTLPVVISRLKGFLTPVLLPTVAHRLHWRPGNGWM